MIKTLLISFLLTFALQADEGFVEVKDAQIYYKTIGQGAPLIVLHGGPGLSHDYLYPQLKILEQSNQVIFYDQRGSGRSTAKIDEEFISIKTYLSDIEALRKTLNLKKVSILGHSWGGFLAINYAIAYPENVEKMILSNSVPATSEEYEFFGIELSKRLTPYQPELTAIQETKGFDEGNPELFEKFYRTLFRAYFYNPEMANELYLSASPEAFLNGAKVNYIFNETLLKKPFDLRPSLRKLNIPTLVIHGDVDIIPLITATHLHENISGSQLIVLKNSGHFPEIESQEPYFHALREFLK